MYKEELIGKSFVFKIEQASAKRGSFRCAVCGNNDTYYKFGGACGSCQTCGANYMRTGGVDLFVADKGQFGPHWIELELESFNDPY
ncbi:MAG: hypothetical protein WCG99_05135 [Candidatus Berkelbacteria bacterium]